MINLDKLKEFLVQAKKATYASGDDVSKIVESDHSKTLSFQEGDFRYHDNYFGGEPYGGREVVFLKNEPIYMMVYYGWVEKDVLEFKEIYRMLQRALLLIPIENPYRGPHEYKEGDYRYLNNFTGEIDRFSGEEWIEHRGREVYRARYEGGLIDQRKEV